MMYTTNPFASHRVRPGAIPYIFRDGESAAALVDRLRSSRWWGEVVGPHGSGKSTLLHTLVPAIRAAGREVRWLRFQGGTLIDSQMMSFSLPRSVVVIDGFEQLSWFERLRWRLLCRWWRSGLLVTAHQPVGLPALYETQVDGQLAQHVSRVLLDANSHEISTCEISLAFAASPGNLRDALFRLYDVFEQRRRGSNAATTQLALSQR
jgi:hypothetical protein